MINIHIVYVSVGAYFTKQLKDYDQNLNWLLNFVKLFILFEFANLNVFV
jgi:hypothetical protein